MEMAKWISELGLPLGLIVFGVVCASRIAKFFAPIATRIAEKHVELIDTLKIQSKRQTRILRSQNRLLMQHGQLLNQIRIALANGGDIDERA